MKGRGHVNTQGGRALSDKIALVAGATRGASRAIAIALGGRDRVRHGAHHAR